MFEKFIDLTTEIQDIIKENAYKRTSVIGSYRDISAFILNYCPDAETHLTMTELSPSCDLYEIWITAYDSCGGWYQLDVVPIKTPLTIPRALSLCDAVFVFNDVLERVQSEINKVDLAVYVLEVGEDIEDDSPTPCNGCEVCTCKSESNGTQTDNRKETLEELFEKQIEAALDSLASMIKGDCD